MQVAAYVTNPTLVSVTTAQPSVIGGRTVVGTVNLSGPAPASGLRVWLHYLGDHPVKIPYGVLVLPGDTSATFDIVTSFVEIDTATTIRAAITGMEKTLVLEVTSFLPNLKMVPKEAKNTLVNGNFDLYTVPANRRALLVGAQGSTIGGGAATFKLMAKIGGNYYRIGGNTAVGVANILGLSLLSIMLEAGEILAINCTVAGNSGMVGVAEFDATALYRSPKLYTGGGGLVAGDQTLYTCPAVKTAGIVNFSPNIFTGIPVSGAVNGGNESGGARTWLANLVKAGDAVANGNRIPGASLGNNAAASIIAAPGGFEAGDFLNVNVDANTASQMVWTTVFETDA